MFFFRQPSLVYKVVGFSQASLKPPLVFFCFTVEYDGSKPSGVRKTENGSADGSKPSGGRSVGGGSKSENGSSAADGSKTENGSSADAEDDFKPIRSRRNRSERKGNRNANGDSNERNSVQQTTPKPKA